MLLEKHGLTAIAVNAFLCAMPHEGEWSDGLLKPEQQSPEIDAIREAKKNLVHLKLHVPDQAAAYLDRAQRLIDKASDAGIPRVCIHGGRRQHVEDVDAEVAIVAKLFDRLGQYAAARNVKLVVEAPHVWTLFYNLDACKKLFSCLQSENIGALIDSTHWHTSDYDLDDYMSFLGTRLWHVHLRDAAGCASRSTGDYQLEITPGRGEVDFVRLAEALDRHRYCGEITLETEYKNYNSPEQVDVENRFALSYLRSKGWEIAAAAPSA